MPKKCRFETPKSVIKISLMTRGREKGSCDTQFLKVLWHAWRTRDEYV